MTSEEKRALLLRRIGYVRKFAEMPSMSVGVIEHATYGVLEVYCSRPVAVWRYFRHACVSWLREKQAWAQFASRDAYLRHWRGLTREQVQVLYKAEMEADVEFCRKLAKGEWMR